MSRRNPSVVEMLILMPWWVSTVLSAVAYPVFTFILPTVQSSNIIFKKLMEAGPQYAPYITGTLAFIALISGLRSWGNGRMLDNQTGLDSLRDLSWKEFEDLVAEAFRRQGYAVEEMLGGGADGGIDMTLFGRGKKTLVQCKRWKNKAVSASVVRELFGVMVAERAEAAILVTTSVFTRDATTFARGKPIELVDGVALEKLVRDVQSPRPQTSLQPRCAARCSPSIVCPKCGSKMLLKTARRGGNAGNQFFGCSRYPACKGTISV